MTRQRNAKWRAKHLKESRKRTIQEEALDGHFNSNISPDGEEGNEAPGEGPSTSRAASCKAGRPKFSDQGAQVFEAVLSHTTYEQGEIPVIE